MIPSKRLILGSQKLFGIEKIYSNKVGNNFTLSLWIVLSINVLIFSELLILKRPLNKIFKPRIGV
tara:strand:+ start:538 stop:732 length:195 start_codon:yes stop_codon:yes gene_type:complete